MRTLWRTLAALLILVAVPASPAAAAGPAGWDHPGYDAEDSYYNPGESAINAATVGGLTRRWSVTLRQHDPSCAGPSAPIVADGRIFVSDDLGISAYQAASGAPIWHFDWQTPEDSSTPVLAVAGAELIAVDNDCNSTSDPNGYLTALDAATGRLRWHVRSDMPYVTVAVDKGVVAISGESPSDELATTAFRASDGHQLWTLPDHSSSGVSANGTLLLTHGPATVAVAITTGAVRWTKPQIWYAKSATPASDRFLVTAGTTLAAINMYDGTVAWTASGKAAELLATDGHRVYRAVGRIVEALDALTGRPRWTRTLPADTRQPVRAGGLLYTGGPVLNAATGTVAVTGSAFAGQQIVTGGRLYAVAGSTLSSFAP